MSINRVTITGNLTRDPEVRNTQSGMSVMSLGVAVNDRRKNNQTGEWEDYANFIDCTMFGTRAQSVSQYLSKGSKVAIEGKLRWSQWERDGQKRSKIEVIVDDLEFMSMDANQQNHQQPQQVNYAPPAQPVPAQMQYGNQPMPSYAPQGQQYSAPPMPAAAPATSVYDENIPF